MQTEDRGIETKGNSKNNYRLVILNDNNFQEKLSVRISIIRVFIVFIILFSLLAIGAIYTVGATSLREHIPGYGDVNVKDSLLKIQSKFDALNKEIDKKEAFLKNIINIIQGKKTIDISQIKRDTTVNIASLKLTPGPNDSLLRLQFELRDRYKLYLKDKTNNVTSSSSFFFFTPVKGMVTSSFNFSHGHYGVDIAGKDNEIIKSTMDGTVVYSGFSSSDGYIIQIQHKNNLLSVYKNNSDAIRKTGDYVKAGDPIAIIGSAGESDKGLHLHFELWYNGKPVNPQQYIVF